MSTIFVSLYSDRRQRASAVARPNAPEPIIRIEEGILCEEEGDMAGQCLLDMIDM